MINKWSPRCGPGKLSKEHKAFLLARLVEEGPIPAVHGAVRWRRAGDPIMRLHEEFGISVCRRHGLPVL